MGLAPCTPPKKGPMAIYHLSAKVISRSTGRSATACAAYRSGEKLTDERTQEVYDYTRKRVDGSEIHAPEHAPEWVHDRQRLWNEVEHAEKRKDAQVAREIEIALPKELKEEDRKELVRSFVKEQCADRGMVADVSFHEQKGENPHAHILLTTRDITPEGFGPKNRDWNRKELLETWREEWSNAANRSLERAGLESRIDHRSLDVQGLEREPQIHLGPHVAQMEARGILTERGSRALEIAERNAELEQKQRRMAYERDRPIEAGEERGRYRAGDRTLGPGDGGPERRAEGSLDRTEGGVRLDTRLAGDRYTAAHHLHPDGHQPSPGHREAVQEPPGGTAQSRAKLHAHDVGLGDPGGPGRWGGSRDRIMGLVETLPADRGTRPALGRSGHDLQQAGPRQEASVPGADGVAPTRGRSQAQDRTVQAVEHQLKAMGCGRYEVGLRDQATGRMLNREWSADQVRENVGWLKRMNAQGNDIYIRPSQQERHGLVLVDDLKKESLARMKEAGHTPALIVETSPRNFQAWVKLQPTPDELRKETARELARTYGGDPMSADARHYGRLAGFTNQKEKYRDAFGQQPYVLARDTNGKEATKGAELIQQAQERIQERAREIEVGKRLDAMREAGTRKHPHGNAIDTYRREAWQLAAKYEKPDWSRVDFAVTKKLALSGRFTAEDLTQAIRTASPLIDQRHQGQVDDYAKRTLQAVLTRIPEAAKAVMDATQSLELEKKLTRGFGGRSL